MKPANFKAQNCRKNYDEFFKHLVKKTQQQNMGNILYERFRKSFRNAS